MSKKNRGTVKEDQKDVKQQNPTPEDPKDEGTEGTDQQQEDKKKFKLPSIHFPKITKEMVLAWLKRIAIFLAGLVTGALGIVAAANIIVKDKAKEDEDIFEEDPEEEDEEPETEDEPVDDAPEEPAE